MKILILANSDVGLFRFRKELLVELTNPGKYNKENSKSYEVYVSLPKGEFSKKIEDIGVEIIDTKMDRRGVNPIKDLFLLFNYLKILREIKPDLVLTYTIKPNCYGGIACRLMKVPYITNITGVGTSLQRRGIISSIVKTLYKMGLKKAQAVFFQNASNKKFFESEILNKLDSILIPGSGVNVDSLVVKEYPIEKQIKFITIARVMKDKGILELLEAASEIKDKHNDVEFYLVGDLEETALGIELNKKVSAGIINYLGFRKDIYELISDSHCTIHPSYHEGLSNVLLESAALARPTLASDIPGCSETLIDGESGYLFKSKDVSSLVEAIEKFLILSHDDKKNFGIRNRKHIEENFDRKIVISKYLQEIKKVTGGYNG